MDLSKDDQLPDISSKRWSSTTKLIVGLSIVAMLALLVVQLRSWIGPFIISFMIAYLFYPVAAWLRTRLNFPWGLAVGLIYLLLVLILLGLLTWGGFTFVDPINSLVNFGQETLNDMPEILDRLSQETIVFGPFRFTFNQQDIQNIANQVLNLVQPILSRTGSILGSFASGAATLVYRIAFMLLISYFILAETKGQPDKVIDISIPGYQEDLRRIGSELSRIWNSFLRGQLILMMIAIIGYSFVLSFMGVKFAFGLALMAGLARFVPYVGPWVTWITYFFVALLQESTVFGLTPFAYAVVVVVIALVFDTFLDNVLMPKVYSSTLRVHPAAVLVAILVSAAWLGLVGVVLAAPVLASIKLLWNYAWYKMLDRDPWQNIPANPARSSIIPFIGSIKVFAVRAWAKIRPKAPSARTNTTKDVEIKEFEIEKNRKGKK